MFSGGSGTKEDPYLVSSVNDLNEIRNYPGSHFKQIQDIDLSGINWEPIPSFYGTYDGQGFKIKNLSIDSGRYSVGLFGACYNTTLKNIEIINAKVHGNGLETGNSWPDVGILAGEILSSEVTNCHIIKSTVRSFKVGTNEGDAAALASFIDNSTISRCSIDQVDVQGYWSGGFASSVFDSDINNCYVLGTVRGSYIGAFVYYLYSGTIKNCYTAVKMILDDNVDPRIHAFANNIWGRGSIISCYTDITATQIDWGSRKIPEARTTAQMMTKSNYVGWDFENVWKINEGVDYPRLIKRYRTQSQTQCKAFIRQAGSLILTPVSD